MSSLPIAAKCLLAWAGFWNLLAFSAMGLDKHRAKTGAWRIPERRLFLFALLGGGPGGFLGMLAFRHKTRHLAFRIGFPALALIDVAAYAYLFLHFAG